MYDRYIHIETLIITLLRNVMLTMPRELGLTRDRTRFFHNVHYDQLYQYLNDNGLLNSGQYGFCSLHSTLTTFLETNDNWCVNIERGLLNGVIFIDLRKAFDTIDHEIILKKTY